MSELKRLKRSLFVATETCGGGFAAVPVEGVAKTNDGIQIPPRPRETQEEEEEEEEEEKSPTPPLPPPGTPVPPCADTGVVNVRRFDPTFVRHQQAVDFGRATEVEISADGLTLAVGFNTGAVELISMTTGSQMCEAMARDHMGPVRGICFHPTRQQILATCSHDNAIMIHDTAAGTSIVHENAHSHWIIDVRFSPDGETLASAGMDGRARLWRCADLLLPSSSSSSSAAATAATTTAAAAGAAPLHTLGDTTTVGLWTVAFNSTGRLLATGGEGRTVNVYDTATGKELIVLRGHTAFITKCLFSPADDSLLVSGSFDHTVRIWKLILSEEEGGGVTGSELYRLKMLAEPVFGVCFASLDGAILAAGYGDGCISLFDVETGVPTRTLRGHSQGITSLCSTTASAPTKRTAHEKVILISGSHDFTVRLWDTYSGRSALLAAVGGGGDHRGSAVTSAVFAPRCDVLAIVSGQTRVVELFGGVLGDDAARRHRLGLPIEHPAEIRALAFARDSLHLITASSDLLLRVWEVTGARSDEATARLALRTIPSHARVCGLCCGLFEGKSAFAVTAEGTSLEAPVRVWSITDDGGGGEPLVTLSPPEKDGEARDYSPGHQLAWSPASRQIASGSDHNSRNVTVWDVSTKRPTFLRGHRDKVWSVAFSQDGAWLASGSDDKTVKVWCCNTLTEIFSSNTLTEIQHTATVSALSFSGDGARLASGGKDCNLVLWSTGLWDDSGGAVAVVDSAAALSYSDALPPRVRKIEACENGVNTVSFSEDSSTIAVASGTCDAHLWDVDALSLQQPFPPDVWRCFYKKDVRDQADAASMGPAALMKNAGWSRMVPLVERFPGVLLESRVDRKSRTIVHRAAMESKTDFLKTFLPVHDDFVDRDGGAGDGDEQLAADGSHHREKGETYFWSSHSPMMRCRLMAACLPTDSDGNSALGFAIDMNLSEGVNHLVKVHSSAVRWQPRYFNLMDIHVLTAVAFGGSAFRGGVPNAAEKAALRKEMSASSASPSAALFAAKKSSNSHRRGSRGHVQQALSSRRIASTFPAAFLDFVSRMRLVRALGTVQGAGCQRRVLDGGEPWVRPSAERDPAGFWDAIDSPLESSVSVLPFSWWPRKSSSSSSSSSPPPPSGGPTNFGESSTSTEVPVSAWVVPMPGVCEWNSPFLSTLVHASEAIGDTSVFENECVVTILHFKWQAFVRALYVRDLVLYSLLIVTHVASTIAMQAASEGDDVLTFHVDPKRLATAAWSLQGVSLLHLGYFIRHEFRQLAATRDPGASTTWLRMVRAHLRDKWNVLDAVTYALAVASHVSVSAGYYLEADFRAFRIVFAILMPLLFLRVMNYLRGFEQFGTLYRMILEITKRIGPFIFVLGTLCVAFALSFMQLFHEIEEDGSYKTIGSALLSVMAWLYGEIDIEILRQGQSYTLTAVLFSLFMGFVVIVLLNLLIAIMSDQHEVINQNATSQWLFVRAQIILEYEDTKAHAMSENRDLFPAWLQVLRSVSTKTARSSSSSSGGGGGGSSQGVVPGGGMKAHTEKLDALDKRLASLETLMQQLLRHMQQEKGPAK